jgi:pimeloyl-ACP methyl ester carboxylesterase
MAFSYRDETEELNELTRKETRGSFVRLSDGFTHYELSNPETKATVVLVHGFSVPYFIFDPTFAFLTQAGFRVLRYALFGRGFSDRPETRYNIDLFVRQLGELLDRLQWTSPVSLVGLSTGGPITATFTLRFPERVNKLALIDPVGAKPLRLGRLLKIAALPWLGEAVIAWLGRESMIRRFASRFSDTSFVENLQERYMIQLHYKGFKRAILSTIRNNMLGSFLDVYQKIGKMHKPVLLFWGRNDRLVPFAHSQVLRAAMPRVEFHAIEDSGHTPHYEKPEEVNPILLKFLKR